MAAFAKSRFNFVDLSFAFVLVAIFWSITFALQWRYGFDIADEGLLWYVSQRTLQGELPILDWFSYDPGRYFWTAGWFSVLGGDGLLQVRLAASAFAMIGYCAVLCVLHHAKIPRTTILLSAVTICIMLCFPRHKNYEHGLVLILAGSIYFTLATSGRYRWVVLGFVTGVAALFGRNSGVYYLSASLLTALASVYFSSERSKRRSPTEFISWSFGVIVGYSPVLAEFVSNARFREAFLKSVQTVGAWQAPLPIQWPWSVRWIGADSDFQHQLQLLSCFYVLLPVLYALGLLLGFAYRRTSGRLAALSVASSIAGICYLHHAFDRADFAHASQAGIVSALSIAALTSLLANSFLKKAKTCSFVLLIILDAFLIRLWLPFLPFEQYRKDPQSYVPLLIDGQKIFVTKRVESMQAIAKHALDRCPISDGQLLSAPFAPGLYALFHLRAPYWELYYFHGRSEAEQRAHIKALETSRTAVAIFNRKETFDSRMDVRLENTNPLLIQYIETEFDHISGNIGDTEAWIRAENCQTVLERRR